jgi:hypothetical protein
MYCGQLSKGRIITASNHIIRKLDLPIPGEIFEGDPQLLNRIIVTTKTLVFS